MLALPRILVASLLLTLSPALSLAQNKCAGAKIRAACKKASCKVNLEAKQASAGGAVDPAKVAKCESKFDATFAKNEAKGGCATTGDAAAIEAKVDAFVADLDTELSVATPNKCQAAKLKAAAKKAACKCKLKAKQAQKGGTIDPAKVAKCESSFESAFAKNEVAGGCSTTGDAPAIEGKVDAFVADVDTELAATASTTSTTSTSSSTTTTVSSVRCRSQTDGSACGPITICQYVPEGTAGAAPAGYVCQGDGTCGPPPVASAGHCCEYISLAAWPYSGCAEASVTFPGCEGGSWGSTCQPDGTCGPPPSGVPQRCVGTGFAECTTPGDPCPGLCGAGYACTAEGTCKKANPTFEGCTTNEQCTSAPGGVCAFNGFFLSCAYVEQCMTP